jgi:uncharacterized membrane protein YidH (DUF202 family)
MTLADDYDPNNESASDPAVPDPRVPLAHQRTELASERSRWAAERTLMAWIRTAISMISFGFAIDKVFLILQLQETKVQVGQSYHAIGITLVAAGILLLICGSVEHLIILKRLRARFEAHAASLNPRFPLPLFGASVVLLIGLVALVLML